MWQGHRTEVKDTQSMPSPSSGPLNASFPSRVRSLGGGSPLATGTLSSSSCLAVFLDNLLDQGVLELPWEQG